jgi:hypothetical protein|tara:strand:- start:37 stop:624 length:588 start_codon:yes stop_codon:yes gene_type:complete
MDPLTIALIAGGGLARGIGGAISQGAQSKALFGEQQQARLAELRRLEEMNALGLTGKEREALEAALLNPAQAAQREQNQRNQALLSSFNLGASKGIRDVLAQQEQKETLAGQAAQKVAAAQLKAQAADEAEMRQLEARQDGAAAARQAAVGAFVGGLGGAADTALRAQALDEMTKLRVQNDLGVDEETLKLIGEF